MKKKFRNDVINSRNLIDQKTLSHNSLKITEKLLSLPFISSASTFMLYLDFKNEVKTDKLVLDLLNMQKTVAAPITIKSEHKLLPHKISNLESDLTFGAYGIREPLSTTLSIDVKDIDVLIVPAVSYDLDGYRLGYGGGFYDRFIESLNPNCITVGIAFELQVFEDIPKEPHDAKLDYIITEDRIINTSI